MTHVNALEPSNNTVAGESGPQVRPRAGAGSATHYGRKTWVPCQNPAVQLQLDCLGFLGRVDRELPGSWTCQLGP